MIKVAILARKEMAAGREPFQWRYQISKHFVDVFNALNALLIPIVSEHGITDILAACDALIIPGSPNCIPPKYYGGAPIEGVSYDVDEFQFDKEIIKLFAHQGKPILGICGGMQTVNVAFGGTLCQKSDGHYTTNMHHSVALTEGSFLHKAFCAQDIMVNSFHYQSVKKAAPGFRVTAFSPFDNVIEGIEAGNIIGVQWHPEETHDTGFFRAFVDLVEY